MYSVITVFFMYMFTKNVITDKICPLVNYLIYLDKKGFLTKYVNYDKIMLVKINYLIYKLLFLNDFKTGMKSAIYNSIMTANKNIEKERK